MDLFETAMKTAFGKPKDWPVRIWFMEKAKDSDFQDFREMLGFERPLVVCDENTHAALGKKVSEKPFILSGKPKPEMKLAAKIADEAANYDSILAIGSGTINDLCKFASHLSEKPYAVLPTAASMNGYTSSTASIIGGSGVKATVKAELPKGILVDLETIAKAPARLTAAGFADFLCRSTVEADWLLSHYILGTNFNPLPFEMMRGVEQELLKKSAGIKKGDKHALTLLMEGLLLGGFGMHICGGSYPASQGEHMIAHALELAYPHISNGFTHGEIIAVTTVYMAELQENHHYGFATSQFPTSTMESTFGKTEATVFMREFGDKKSKITKASNLSESVLKNAMKHHIGAKKIRGVLENAGSPTTPDELGISKEDFVKIAQLAKFTRSRFTFLDLE